ncbi:MAG: hemerythrin family protein [Burkholderiales bacterium]|nr:hemerythrin family protein [Burkholderiales bacterium]
MQVFAWQAGYEVGDPEVDDQHRHLFTLANHVLAATGRSALAHAAVQLHDYVREHFGNEEGLMRRVNYPERSLHEALHDELIARLNAISSAVAAGAGSREELRQFLSHWLLGHIATQDSRLCAYVRAVGGRAAD